MPKRNAKNSLTEVNFAIIETVRGDADVVVEFVPYIWLRPVENKPLSVRETAKCFYSRRTENQNVNQYLNHLKRTKFECMQPKYTKEWELLDCRVLKIGIGNFGRHLTLYSASTSNSINDCICNLSFIGSFIEAVNAEKFFSDFFNTTDAEAEMAAAASGNASVVAPKRLRKKRSRNNT